MADGGTAGPAPAPQRQPHRAQRWQPNNAADSEAQRLTTAQGSASNHSKEQPAGRPASRLHH